MASLIISNFFHPIIFYENMNLRANFIPREFVLSLTLINLGIKFIEQKWLFLFGVEGEVWLADWGQSADFLVWLWVSSF